MMLKKVKKVSASKLRKGDKIMTPNGLLTITHLEKITRIVPERKVKHVWFGGDLTDKDWNAGQVNRMLFGDTKVELMYSPNRKERIGLWFGDLWKKIIN